MNNKYYTPKIEEFHVGFECEWQSRVRNETWNKQISDTDLVSIAYDAIEHSDEDEPFEEQFRVKYLDKDDIEGCGFILTGKPNDSKYYFRDVDDMLGITVRVGFYKNGGNNLHLYEFIGDRIETLFSGEIKNKTELKTLLKKINGKNKTTGKSL